MKTVIKRLAFLAKTGLVAGLLATGHTALAQDTVAGTPIDNTASISFTVGGIQQTAVDSDTASFVVDRRVDYDITLESPGLEAIVPNQPGLELAFLLTNESNDTLDFSLLQSALADGASITGATETATGQSMDNVSIEVAPSFIGGGGDEDPTRGANNNSIDDLPPGETIRIIIYSDAPGTLPDASRPAIELEATASESDGTPITDDSGDVDDPAAVQNVLVNGTVTFTASDGFTVTAGDVSATKASEVVEDPFSGTTNPKSIPGAFIEYTFVITNNATGNADGVTIDDSLDTTLVALRDGAYDDGGTPVNVDLGGGNYCNADANNADGCTYDPVSGDLQILVGALAGNTSRTIRFQVVVQ